MVENIKITDTSKHRISNDVQHTRISVGLYGNNQCFLPSKIALNPWALTAKSVVNHSAKIDPELTMGDGNMKPDNLK